MTPIAGAEAMIAGEPPPTRYDDDEPTIKAMTPKPDDAKPDPLEELKGMRAWWGEHATCSVPNCFQCKQIAKLAAAIAAWEKERADATRQQRAEIYNKLLVLRAAVESCAGMLEMAQVDAMRDGVPISDSAIGAVANKLRGSL